MVRFALLSLSVLLLAAPAGADPLPLVDLDGAPVALAPRPSDRALVVHFFATWCPECVRELPLLSTAAPVCASSGVRIVAVDVDEDPHVLAAFLAAHPVSLRVLRDPDGAVWGGLRARGLPTNLVWRGTEERIEVGARDADAWRKALAALGCSEALDVPDAIDSAG